MKSTWKRTKPIIHIDLKALLQQSSYLRQYRDNQESTMLELLKGGLSTSNYKLQIGKKTFLIKLTEQLELGQKEYEIRQELSATIVPLPQLFEHDTIDLGNKTYGLIIMEYLEGTEQLSTLLEQSRLGKQDEIEIYVRLGRILAQIHMIQFETSGFLSGELDVQQVLNYDKASYISIIDDFPQDVLYQNFGNLYTKLRETVDLHLHLFDNLTSHPVLNHGDFNPENILIQNNRVAGIIDWEFTLSYCNLLDIGNLLRSRDDLNSAVVKSFIRSYQRYIEDFPKNWKPLIRLFDGIALLSMASRSQLDTNQKNDIAGRITKYINELENSV